MRCAVLGDPVAHSLSPVLHRAAYDALGLDWTYEAVRVASGGLGGFLDGMTVGVEGGGWRGLSLTMPLKREVLGLVSARTAAVDLAGGANTVVVDDDGGLRLDNTDLPGAVAAIRERWPEPVSTGLVVGAGATAASTGLALCDLGARHVHLLARSAKRAAATASAISAHPARPTVTVGGLDDPTDAVPDADVLVSTIPAAAQSARLLERVADVAVVFEVLYDPWPTPLAAAALAADRVLVGGLDLLVHQAVLQVELFTGHPGPLEAMRAAGAAALDARLVR